MKFKAMASCRLHPDHKSSYHHKENGCGFGRNSIRHAYGNGNQNYICTDIVDGTSWNVDITYSGKILKSGGRNAYPYFDDDEDVFGYFLKAVSTLVGGLTFL